MLLQVPDNDCHGLREGGDEEREREGERERESGSIVMDKRTVK